LLACVLALGCGNDNVHHLNDGGGDAPMGPADAAPDAAPTPGLVSLTVTDGGSGVAGAVVYFLNADNSVVAEMMTDGSGVASATMAPGGSVTLLEPQPVVTGPPPIKSPSKHPDEAAPPPIDNQNLITWEGVKPGDNLRDDLDPIQPDPAIITLTVTIPTDPNTAATQYTLFGACVGGVGGLTPGSAATLTLQGCGSATDFLVQTSDVNGNVLDFLFAPAVAIGDGSAVTLPGTYQTGVLQPFTLSDVPAEFSGAFIDQEMSTSLGVLYDDSADVDVTAGGGSGTIALPVLGSGATEATEIQLFDSGNNIFDQQELTSWGPEGASFAADIGTTRLKNWVTSPQADSADDLVSWSLGKDGAQPDYVIALVRDLRPDAQAGVGDDNWNWLTIAPGGADGTVVFPQLPTDVFDFNWRDTDDAFVEQTVAAVTPGGYDTARALIIDDFGLVLDAPQSLAQLAPTGSVIVQSERSRDTIARVFAHHAHPRHVTRNGKVAR
jgi:hypothetical protein